MNLSFKQQVERFVENKISEFHEKRATNVASLKLKDVLRAKNPYLFRAKNIQSASEMVSALLEARLSSAEEGMFGGFMEALAIFVSEEKCNGRKSGTTGIDIDLVRDNVRYLIAVKSGKAWGNSTQHKKLRDNFQTAVKVLRQNKGVGHIQPTLGICYGNFKTTNNGAFLHIGGQSFWELISGEPDLYMDIIEPIGYRAKEFNDEFYLKRANALNRMEREFLDLFCKEDGSIDWPKIVTLVSKSPQNNSAEAS
jgi:hypothetical protein